VAAIAFIIVVTRVWNRTKIISWLPRNTAPRSSQIQKRYASEIGSGAVVHKLGFETDHVAIAGVHSFREAEVLHSLERQPKLRKELWEYVSIFEAQLSCRKCVLKTRYKVLGLEQLSRTSAS
jgi:hypothetical protein